MATDRLAGLLQCPADRPALTPAELLRTLQRLRSEAAAEVERLIALMDAIDADADLEPSGDEAEPELGAAEAGGSEGPPPFDYWSDAPHRTDEGSQLRWADGSTDDREHCADLDEDDSHDGREPDVDDEPSLGAINPTLYGSQAGWAGGTCDDREDEHDGRELAGDEHEPSLGSFDRLMDHDSAWRQAGNASFTNNDAEVDCQR